MFGPQSEHGQLTPTDTPAVAAPTLPLSSVARALIVELGLPWAFQVYDQLVVPVRRVPRLPPSVETSTPATTPPPPSLAVPVSVTCAPSATLAGGARP